MQLYPSQGYLREIVLGCIIDQDDLEVRAVLCRNTVESRLEIVSLVEADHDDSDQRGMRSATIKEDAVLSRRLDHVCLEPYCEVISELVEIAADIPVDPGVKTA
jgi:hypothetical protein